LDKKNPLTWLVVKWIVSSLTVQQEIEQFFDNFYDQPA